jgi:tetratricopeptide (TPR) repeat protein
MNKYLYSFLFILFFLYSLAQKQKLPHLCNTDSLSKVYTYNQQKREIAYSLKNIGYIYNGDNNIKKSLDYYNRSLKVCEEINDKEGIANLLFNIGKICNNQGNRKQALDYRDKSTKINELAKKKLENANSLNKLAYSYNNKGEVRLALNNYYLSLKIFFDINDKQGIVNTLNNIGTIYINQGDTKQGTGYYDLSLKIKDAVKKRSLAIKEEVNNQDGIAYSMNNIGAIYLSQQNYRFANLYADSALRLAKELNYPISIYKAESLLSKIDSALAASLLTPIQRRGELIMSAEAHYKQYLIYKDRAEKNGIPKASTDTHTVIKLGEQPKQNNQEVIKTTAKVNKKAILILSILGLLLVSIYFFIKKKSKKQD